MSKNLIPELARGPYQCLDPLSPEDFAALEADILERGVLIPIEFDQDGNVLDGHHRLLICAKHGITDYPTITRTGLSEAEKRTHARRMNLARRQLNRDQRRKLIEQELREFPETSNRKISSTLGVDHKTVGSIRTDLESTGEIPQSDTRVKSNGIAYKTVRRSPRPRSDAPVDADGNVVPAPLVSVFESVSEFVSLSNTLTDIKRRMLDLGKIVPAVKAKDHLIRRHVDKLQEILGVNQPHSVHCDCGGDGCADCGGNGYRTTGEIPQSTEGSE